MCEINKARSIFLKVNSKESHAHEVICVETELPPLAAYGVLIHVKACGLAGTHDRLFPQNPDASRLPAGASVAGVVMATGDGVTSVTKGDHVVGLLPLDSGQSGCSDYVVLGEYEVCVKPPGVSWVDAAGSTDHAFRAYVALNYLGRLTPGDTVLVVDGASSVGSLCVQMAHQWRAKVIATCATEDQKHYLQSVNVDVAHLVYLGDMTTSLQASVMMETGNLGADVVVDPGVRQFKQRLETSAHSSNCSPSKHEVISCLAVGGRWVTSTLDLQLDPPDTTQLFLRGACVGFLYEQAWLLSAARQGRYQHILRDIMLKLDTKAICANIHHTVSFDEIVEALSLPTQPAVGRIVMTTSLP